MSRILLVSGTIPPEPCGVGDYTLSLARSLAADCKLEIAILTGTSAAAHESTDIQIFRCLPSWNVRDALHAIRILRLWKPDILHVQYPTQGYGRGFLPYLLPVLARIFGIASVQTWHEGFGRRDALKLLIQLAAFPSIIVVRANFMELVHPWLRRFIMLRGINFIANASAIPRTKLSRQELLGEREKLLHGQRRLLVFFGFLYPAKGVELLFEIADSATDHIVIAGPSEKDSPYAAELAALAAQAEWQRKVTFAGFISPERVAVLLAAADAVILPFRKGGGHWNTSIHSAVLNGAFVITTSIDQQGYNAASNVFCARPDDVAEMRSALATYGGRRDNFDGISQNIPDDWQNIAERHCQIYRSL